MSEWLKAIRSPLRARNPGYVSFPLTPALALGKRRPRTLIAPCALEQDGEGARPVPGRSGHARPRAFDRSRFSGAGTCCGRGLAAVRFMGSRLFLPNVLTGLEPGKAGPLGRPEHFDVGC